MMNLEQAIASEVSGVFYDSTTKRYVALDRGMEIARCDRKKDASRILDSDRLAHAA